MPPIAISVFDLLKIGPGPSSSHTIGPMKAGFDFYSMMQKLTPEQHGSATELKVLLYGSLAATGLGHGTDRAVLAGLMGQSPETCPPDFLDSITLSARQPLAISVGGNSISFRESDMLWDHSRHDFPYSNTMVMRLTGKNGMLLEKEYYSVGGGFLQWKGWQEEKRGKPAYPYENGVQLWNLLRKHRITLDELMLANETAITGMTSKEIYRRLDRILDVMEDSVSRGVRTEGFLPGPIGLHRKAALMFQRAEKMPQNSERMLVFLCAYAFAAAEENASGHMVVTAPTCGSAGVVPAVVRLLMRHRNIKREWVRKALLASTAIAMIARQNASISGAEVGCQGEIGVASSMAAALVALAHGCDVRIAENAAETALEHHLGMTCDPVKGYVQIPCIERNAMGAVKAWTSYLIAREGLPDWHIVGLDKAIEAMRLTGRDMNDDYRETARGGLARCC